MKILGICGSLQRTSGNLMLLNHADSCTPPDVEFVLFDGIRELPHFNPDIDREGTPESVTRWRRALTDSDAVLIASPEYGFSLPGVLKNGIDWVIGSGELEGKVVAITAAVPAPERGRRGLQALRDTLSAVRATIVGGEPIAKGPEFGRYVAELVRSLVAEAANRWMSDIVIRPALQSERSSLEALQWRASLANSGDRDSLLTNPDAIALPVGQIADGHVLVAQRDGVMIGFAAVLPRPDGDAELDALFVEPRLWKRGVGRLLVEHCADVARGRASRILHVIGNPHAERFYLACAFKATGAVETRFGVGLAMQRGL